MADFLRLSFPVSIPSQEPRRGVWPRRLAAKFLPLGLRGGGGFGPSSFFLSKDRSNRACYARFGATPACPSRRTRKYFRKERLGQPTRSEAQLVLSVGAGLDKLAIGASLDGIRRFHMNSSKEQGRLAFQAPRLS